MNIIDEKIKKLPEKPGVYLMKNKSGEVIYVGKAKILKNRVRSYFQKSKNKTPKLLSLIENIYDLEYIIVETEVEALVLEANLIKKYRPKYNVLLRDDKQYPYIKVTINEKYPRVIKTRSISRDGSKYFGPYPSVSSVNDTLDIIGDLFKIRTCNRNLDKDQGKKRPCLNYHIKRCLGPCINDDFIDEYSKYIQEILIFLEGKKEVLINHLEENMKYYSSELEFEKAAEYRDKIESIKLLQENQKVEDANKNLDQDVIGLASQKNRVAFQTFFIREGKILGREYYIIDNKYKDGLDEIISSFLKQFYINAAHIPKEILLPYEIEEISIYQEWLSKLKNGKVDLVVPKRGQKYKLLKMANDNAEELLEKYADRYMEKSQENALILEELQEILGINEDVNRIEAFDISNIGGSNSVGSMVVFENGISKKSDYRRFRIKTVEGPDDYSSIEEVLTRRFKRGLLEKEKNSLETNSITKFSQFPDLIMLDGGKGQVNIGAEVLSDLGIEIPICGLVKDDFHQTRGIIYNNKEIPIDQESKLYKFIYKIQEEAHRFAISYHRSLRSKDMFKSELDGIKGIGDKRKRDLLTYFKSIEKIKSASVDELLQVKSMTRPSAESLYYYFNKKE